MRDASHPSPHFQTTPAIALALALLVAFSACGAWVVRTVRMVPGTSLPSVYPAQTTPPQSLHAIAPDMPTPLHAGPGWGLMTRSQKLALYPLAERWDYMTESQKRRWMALAETFSGMPEQEQDRLHERMTAWAGLSAQQRSQARLNFAATRSLSPVDIQAEWEAYQDLSDEKKKKLAASAPKPHGAATALKPIASKRLAHVPAPTEARAIEPNPPKVVLPLASAVRVPSTPEPVPLPAAPPLPPSVTQGSTNDAGRDLPPKTESSGSTPRDPLPDIYIN